MMEEEGAGPPHRELYALLHVSPDATDEEIRKAYRQWAQIYHPDKYQDAHMKETATENFQRICEAYEILSDENKRQIYDIYGMEGLASGLELGPKLSKVEEIKEELERLKKLLELEKMSMRFQSSGTIFANMSLPHLLDGDGIMRGMAMNSEIQSKISRRNAIAIGGNLAINEDAGMGLGSATALLRHEISSYSSVEFYASAGGRDTFGVRSSRQLSKHVSATMGLERSLRNGHLNLSNAWTRQLSETAVGNIELNLGSESSISVGWKKKGENMSASGLIKFGVTSYGAQARYVHRFSSKSTGRIAGRLGSSGMELEVGGGREVSKFSKLNILYAIGIEGIFWKVEFYRGGQKLIIPILLSRHFNPFFASGALIIPASLYFLLKKFVVKPYYLKREKQKILENMEKNSSEVRKARAAAEKAQQLLQNVANRKRNRQMESGGLVITKAIYGNQKVLRRREEPAEGDGELSQVIDVTLPLNFLVSDSGLLKLHEGVKKSGIMGFCDPCPGEPKQLFVEYLYGGNRYEVLVDDCEELLIPQPAHRI